MALTIGTQLGAHEISALLGKGAMVEVYHARDLKRKGAKVRSKKRKGNVNKDHSNFDVLFIAFFGLTILVKRIPTGAIPVRPRFTDVETTALERWAWT